MGITKDAAILFLKPQNWADGKLTKETPFVESIGPRALYLLQALASIVAIFVLPLIACIEKFIELFLEKKESPPWSFVGRCAAEHILLGCPMGFLIAFANTDYSIGVADRWFNKVEPFLR